MVAKTFVSLHLYGYGTVLATLQKIFTTDGRRPRSTTRFYNGFGVDSMYMTTECMEVQLFPRYEGQLNHMAESTSPPIRSLPPYILTTLIITPSLLPQTLKYSVDRNHCRGRSLDEFHYTTC